MVMKRLEEANWPAQGIFLAAIPIYFLLVGNAMAFNDDIWEIRLAGTTADIPQSVFSYEGNSFDPPSDVCGVRLEGIVAYDWGTSIAGGCPCTTPGSGGTPDIPTPDFIEVRNIPALGEQCGPVSSAAEVVVDDEVVDFASLGITFLIAQNGKYRWLDRHGDVIPPPDSCAPNCKIDPVLVKNPGVSLWIAVLNTATLADLLEDEVVAMVRADQGEDTPTLSGLEPMRRVAVALHDGLADTVVAGAIESHAAADATPDVAMLVEALASARRCVALLTHDQLRQAADATERLERACGEAARSTVAAARNVSMPMGLGID
jgi:hypothetical protein